MFTFCDCMDSLVWLSLEGEGVFILSVAVETVSCRSPLRQRGLFIFLACMDGVPLLFIKREGNVKLVLGLRRDGGLAIWGDMVGDRGDFSNAGMGYTSSAKRRWSRSKAKLPINQATMAAMTMPAVLVRDGSVPLTMRLR